MAHASAPQWFVEGTTPTRRWLGQFTDLAHNNNKELLIELFTGPNGATAMRTRWGKTGSIEGGNAQCHWQIGADTREFNAKIAEKSSPSYKTPYTENKLADQSTVKITAKPTSVRTSKTLDAVDRFTAHIVSEAGRAVAAVLRNDVGLQDFAPEQVDAAKQVLVKLAPYVERYATSGNASLKDDIIGLSNKYFSLIPHQRGDGPMQIPTITKGRAFEVAVSSKKRLEAEYDFLDQLLAAVANKAAFQAPADDVAHALGAVIKLADADTTRRIQRLMTSNIGNHRQYSLPGAVYEVMNPKVNGAFLADGDKVGNVQELIHGSRASNWHGIISQGIRIKPPGVPHAGSMFGNGAYFADNPMKSYGYTDGGRLGKRFMAVCAVALGKIKVHHESHHYNSAPAGFDSVKGEAGRSLYHNEYIIYRPSQHDLRYIVEFD